MLQLGCLDDDRHLFLRVHTSLHVICTVTLYRVIVHLLFSSSAVEYTLVEKSGRSRRNLRTPL